MYTRERLEVYLLQVNVLAVGLCICFRTYTGQLDYEGIQAVFNAMIIGSLMLIPIVKRVHTIVWLVSSIIALVVAL